MNLTGRYVLGGAFVAALCLGCVSLVVFRAEIEPVVRWLHPFLLGRRAGPYEPADYLAYEGLAGLFGAAGLAALAYGLATKARTDRRIDRFLEKRLPRHRRSISGDDL